MKRKLIGVAVMCLSIFCTPAYAQMLKDTAATRMICKGTDYIFNLQFNRAHEIYREMKTAYPEHPMTYIFEGMINYWENYPLTATSETRSSYEKSMKHAIQLCEKVTHPNDYCEYLLCNLGARGMLLLFYADNDLNLDVISLASGTYPLLRQSFNYTDKYADFYFFTGLYNYYREAYPDAHPVYKPLARLFPKGDMASGLEELEKASKTAMVLKGESYSFLNLISINFENNYQHAKSYAKELHELYPDNIAYLSDYIKNLLLIKDYNEAEGLIISGQSKSSNDYYRAQFLIMNGILYEKKYHDLKQAQAYYSEGIRKIEPYGKYGNEYAAYAYFGLSRISEVGDDKHYKKMYHKQAIELATYKKINFDD